MPKRNKKKPSDSRIHWLAFRGIFCIANKTRKSQGELNSYLTVGVLKVVEIRAHEARSGTSAESRASKDGSVHRLNAIYVLEVFCVESLKRATTKQSK